MAENFTFPGGTNTYVPSLTGNLIVDYSRSPDRFPVNRYADVNPVEKMTGYYVRFRNEDQARVVSNSADYEWPDGADRPTGNNQNQHEMPLYFCQRKSYAFKLGHLAVQQAGWDMLAVEVNHKANQAMTARSDRVASFLTTTGNWPSTNTSSATSLAGGQWTSASSSNPYIKKSILKAINVIAQQTNAAVSDFSQFKLVINPNTAQVIASSAEFIDFLKQSPSSQAILEGPGNWNARYGLPPTLYGVEVVVEDTTKVTTVPNAGGATAGTRSFVWGDSYAAIMTKQKAIQGSVGGGFSTFAVFVYAPDEMAVEVFNDTVNRVYKGSVTENADEIMTAGESGYLITSIQ